jgi:hypothetical protein
MAALTWSLRWGPKAGETVSAGDWLSKITAQTGRVFKELEARPTLQAHELPFWEAFQVLQLSRPNTGFGPGAIPLSEMLVYAELMQMPIGEDREQFVQTIRAMDGAYLTWVRKTHG